jgi:hypothetical protein
MTPDNRRRTSDSVATLNGTIAAKYRKNILLLFVATVTLNVAKIRTATICRTINAKCHIPILAGIISHVYVLFNVEVFN